MSMAPKKLAARAAAHREAILAARAEGYSWAEIAPGRTHSLQPESGTIQHRPCRIAERGPRACA